MKRIALAMLAAVTLTSCSLAEEELSSEPDFESETAAAQTYVFTGLPDISTLRTETETEPVTVSAELASEAETEAPEEQPNEAAPIAQPSDAPPEGLTCLEVPYISQDGAPAGCELVCASMLLGYYDFHITADELISDGYIDVARVDTYEDDERGTVMFSGDPNKEFIGDPHTSYGYGCFSGAIRSCLRRYLDREMFDAVDISGISLKDLCMEYIDWGEPVIVWASVDMEPLVASEANIWEIEDTDETVEWKSNEHCYLLVGYDEEHYCFHDPQRGAYTLYPRDIAEARYREMGSQAVTIHPW